VPLSAYRAQRRGGQGPRPAMQTRDEDFVSRLFVASTHTPVLFFSSRGQVYKEKVWRASRWAAPKRGARQGADQYPAPWSRASASPPSCRCRRMNPPWAELDVMFATTGGNRPPQTSCPTSSMSARSGHHRHEAWGG